MWTPASISTRLALGAVSSRRVDCQLEFAGAAGLTEPIGKLRGFVVSRGRRKCPGNHRLFDSVCRRRQLFSPRGLDCYGRFQCEHRSARGDSQYYVSGLCTTGPARGTQPIALKPWKVSSRRTMADDIARCWQTASTRTRQRRERSDTHFLAFIGPTEARRYAVRISCQARRMHASRHGRILTLPPTPSPPRSGREGRGEEEIRRNHWQAQIKNPSPQPSPRASLRGEGVNYGGSGKMRPVVCAATFAI